MWAEVDPAAIRHNAEFARRRAGAPLIAVVKANAYGHGVEVAVHALREIAELFAVANVEEAAAVRALASEKDLLLLSPCLPAERAELGALPGAAHWDRILFCAKEATYKAWFPLTHRWLGFEDAHITFSVDGSGSAGGFEARILVDPQAESGPPLTSLSGRWSVDDGLVLTAIVL